MAKRYWAAVPIYDEQPIKVGEEITGVFDAERLDAMLAAGDATTTAPKPPPDATAEVPATTTRKRGQS